MLKILKQVLKRIWAIYWHGIALLCFLMIHPAMLICLTRKSWYPLAQSIRRAGSFSIFLLTGVILKISWDQESKQLIKQPHSPVIICANHTSTMDIMTLLIVFNHYFRFLAKSELLKIPFLKTVIQKLDIPVERNHKIEKANKSYDSSLDSLTQNINLMIFPEGTTSKKPPALLPFKMGAFNLAVEKNVPIIPVVLLDNWKLLPYTTLSGKPGISRVKILKPVMPQGYTPEMLKDLVFNMIQTTLLAENK